MTQQTITPYWQIVKQPVNHIKPIAGIKRMFRADVSAGLKTLIAAQEIVSQLTKTIAS